MHNSVQMGRLSGDIPHPASDRTIRPWPARNPPQAAPEPEPDQPEWRRPSVHRADQRNVVTYVDKQLGSWIKTTREARGLSQPEAAERMLLPDGTPHPTSWGWRAREGRDTTKQQEKTTRDMKAKQFSRIEAVELAPTFSTFISVAIALDSDPGDALKAMGFSKGNVSTESAIMADPKLTAEKKQAMLVMYRQLLG